MDELTRLIRERLEEIVSLLIAIEQNTRPIKPTKPIKIVRNSGSYDKDNLFG